MAQITCGSCHEKHDTVAQVRLCYENKARRQAQEREEEAQAKAEMEAEARYERFLEEGPHGPQPEDPREVEAQMMDDLRRETAAIQQRERDEDYAAYTFKMRRDEVMAGEDEEAQAALALDGLTGAGHQDMASRPQVDYIMDLLVSREWPDALTRDNVEAMPRNQASKLIEALKVSPERKVKTAEPDAGVYIVDGEYHIHVYHGQRSGRMLAKRIIIGAEKDASGFLPVSYEYIGTAAKVRSKSHTFVAMSMEEVGSLGVSTNHCMICGRRLDDPVSVDRGIGPVCIDKMGWAS